MLKMMTADGRPVAFVRDHVLLIEAHPTGDGTIVRLGPVSAPYDLHVTGGFDEVHRLVTETLFERFAREDAEAGAEGKEPF